MRNNIKDLYVLTHSKGNYNRNQEVVYKQLKDKYKNNLMTNVFDLYILTIKEAAAVAQWVKALASQAKGCVRISAATNLSR